MAVNVATDSADVVVLDDPADGATQDVNGVEPVEFDPNLTEAEVNAAVDQAFEQVAGEAPPELPPDQPSDLPPDPTIELEKLRGELRFRTTFETELSGVSTAVEKAAAEVMKCESVVEEAKGDLKSAREKYDQVVCELRELTRDFAHGQWRLPFEGPAGSTASGSAGSSAAPPATGEMVPAEINGDLISQLPKVIDPAVSSPVSELGKKKLKEIVGAEEFERANNTEEPIGLTDKQVETIEGDGCVTISDLEKKLKSRPLFLEDLKGFGPAAQNKLQWSLYAWRKKFPQPPE